MVPGFFKRTDRRPGVPTGTYGPLLGTALSAVANFRDMGQVSARNRLDSSSVEVTEAQVQGLFEETIAECQALHDAVVPIEGIKPADKHIHELHMHALAFLRAMLTYHDRHNAAAIAAVQDRGRDAEKLRRESEGWFRSLMEVMGKFARELRSVRQRQPQVYTALRLPEDALAQIGFD